jgi:uncharacterized protein (DUF305 family)
MNIRRPLAPLVVGIAVTLTACGSDDPADSANTSLAASAPAPVASVAEGTVDPDVEFAQGMIAHHEQALEMAEIALDPTVGASPEVVDLATRIQAAQEPEIEQMTAWLTEGGHALTMDTSDGHDMSSMPGMMTAEEMDTMAAMTGTEFDTMWLGMMIAHHEGAVVQAEALLAEGDDPELRALAEEIIAAQQGEIEEMRALLEG